MTAIAPGHGAVLEDPYSAVDWIIQHRLEREKKILESLRTTGQGSSDSLVEAVYEDVDSSLFPIAKWSLESHLIKLLEDGAIPVSKVGTHRGIRFQDVMEDRTARNRESEAALQALADQAQEHDMGY